MSPFAVVLDVMVVGRDGERISLESVCDFRAAVFWLKKLFIRVIGPEATLSNHTIFIL